MFTQSRAATFRWLPVCAALVGVAFGQQPRQDVLVGAKLAPSFNMGVDSSERKTNWLKTESEQLRMSYPSDQSWGAVFITVGAPKQPPRPFRDLSAYNVLTIEMKGGVGGEHLEIGIKTNTQPDDGSETKVPVTLTADWKPYQFRLDKFDGADPDKLYVVTEFVFSGSDAFTVFARNINYSRVPK
jgi:hypothetical protein